MMICHLTVVSLVKPTSTFSDHQFNTEFTRATVKAISQMHTQSSVELPKHT